MEYLVLVEKQNGSTETFLFPSSQRAEQYRASVLNSRHVKAAWIYKQEQ